MKRILIIVGLLIGLSGGAYWYLDSLVKKINVEDFNLGLELKKEEGGFSIPVLLSVKNDNAVSFKVKDVSVMIVEGTTLLAQTTIPQTIRIAGKSITQLSHRMTVYSAKKISTILMNPGKTPLTIIFNFRVFMFDFSKTFKQTF